MTTVEQLKSILESVPEDKRTVGDYIDLQGRICPVTALSIKIGPDVESKVESLKSLEEERQALLVKPLGLHNSRHWEKIYEIEDEQREIVSDLVSSVEDEYGISPYMIMSDTDTKGWPWVINHLESYLLY